MSETVRAVSASIDSSILSSKMKEEQHKNGKADNYRDCELKDQHTHADCIGKDLADEINKKPESDDELCTQVQGAAAAAADGSLKLSSELSVGPHEQVEKDKDDRSLSDCKQQVLRSIDISTVSESKEGEVKVLSMSILSPGCTDVVLAIPFPTTTSKATLFTLKEGSKYRTIFHFTASNNVVHGLCYTYTVWKAGVRVCNIKKMMGTFSPREEPYTFELEEGTTPSGFFARGSFLVRSKFVDNDGKCYLDTTYYFDIRKDWGARDKC